MRTVSAVIRYELGRGVVNLPAELSTGLTPAVQFRLRGQALEVAEGVGGNFQVEVIRDGDISWRPDGVVPRWIGPGKADGQVGLGVRTKRSLATPFPHRWLGTLRCT